MATTAKSTTGQIASTDPVYTFAVTESRTLTAVFEPIPVYTITATIDPSGGGTITGAGQYQEGDTVTLVATAGNGYNFKGWQEDGSMVSTGMTYTFTAAADRVLTAVFKVVRLPADYQEVEYVDFDGASARVDNALNNEFAYYGFELYVELLPASSDGTIVGQSGYYTTKSGTTTYNTYTKYSVDISGDNIRFYSYSSKVSQGYTPTYKTIDLPKQSGKMKIKYDLGSTTFSVNDTSGTLAATRNNSTVVANAQIGCCSNKTTNTIQNINNTTYSAYTAFRFYEMKSFDTTGKDVIRHLVPCRRKSDNKVGLYDIQQKVFRTPTGTLIAGPDA